MMIKWLRDSESRVPDYATQSIGVGGFVVDEQNNVLVIKEQRATVIEWKLPGNQFRDTPLKFLSTFHTKLSCCIYAVAVNLDLF